MLPSFYLCLIANKGFPGRTSGKVFCMPMHAGSISESGRSPEGGHDNPCLQNFMDRGTWHTMVHKVAKVRHYWSNLACMYCQYKYFYILKQVFLLKMYLHITVWFMHSHFLKNKFCLFYCFFLILCKKYSLKKTMNLLTDLID